MVLNLCRYGNHLPNSSLRVSDSLGLQCGPQIWIFTKFPGNTNVLEGYHTLGTQDYRNQCKPILGPFTHTSIQPLLLSLCQFWAIWQRRQQHPTPVLLPGKSHGRRSLEGCSPWGRWRSDTTERLHFHFSLSCTGEGNGNLLQCSCLENPRDGGVWWAAVSGVTESDTTEVT